jgi:hypothetical protein
MTERWTDPYVLDQKFSTIDDQLIAMRDLPARVASFDLAVNRVNERLDDVKQAQHEQWIKLDEHSRILNAIQITVATLNTKVAFGAALGTLVGGGAVTALFQLTS